MKVVNGTKQVLKQTGGSAWDNLTRNSGSEKHGAKKSAKVKK